MVIVDEVKGDLLQAPQKYIAQQCNCVTVRAHGLSHTIANRWPEANVYGKRTPICSRNCAVKQHRDVPGTITKIQTGDGKVIVCMFGQYCPGKPGRYSKVYGYNENAEDRIGFFRKCLEELDADPDIGEEEVAMPWRIGCGLAGGHWETYRDMLEECQTRIVLYRM